MPWKCVQWLVRHEVIVCTFPRHQTKRRNLSYVSSLTRWNFTWYQVSRYLCRYVSRLIQVALLVSASIAYEVANSLRVLRTEKY